jgi:hypothetical protein
MRVLRGGWVLCLVGLMGATAAVAATPATATNPDTAILEDVIRRVKEQHAAAVKNKGKDGVVIFDLDDTAFRCAFRTKHILQDWAAQNQDAGIRERVEALEPFKMTYSLGPNLAKLLLTPEQTAAAKDFWGKSFFSDAYCKDDVPCAGAVDYLNAIHKAHGIVVYLTGRDEPRMGKGTRACLKRHQFPMDDDHVGVFLKPSKDITDLVFKEQAMVEIKKLGPVIAGFDNEPGNVNLLKKQCPEAVVVHFDTVYSDNAPPLDPGILKVKTFERLP